MRLAAIDIGSNAARLLISEAHQNSTGEKEFTKLNLLRIPLRLGFDVFKHGEILHDRKAMLINSMKVFADLMQIYEVERYRACATSAMRDAANGDALREIIKETSGMEIEIISGDEEASIIYENHVAESLENDHDYLYIDVGGGSTELMFFESGKLTYKKSFNVGTIRLLTGTESADVWDDMQAQIQKKIKGEKPVYAIGSGGNINKVYSMSKTKDGKPLLVTALRKFHKELAALSVEERMSVYDLREDRADVLVPALEIFNRVMGWANISKIFVPKISVADGLIKDMYAKILDGTPAGRPFLATKTDD